MNETVMNRELYKPIARAMTALFLVVLVKFAAVLTLKSAVEFYSFVDIHNNTPVLNNEKALLKLLMERTGIYEP